MWRNEFIDAATGRSFPGPTRVTDNPATRRNLADRFEHIHRSLTCEHAMGESFLVADAIFRLQAPGPVIECGCFRGGFTAKLSLVCAATGRDLRVFDSFLGLPGPDLFGGNYQFYPQRSDVHAVFGGLSQQFRRGDYYATLAEVRHNVRFLGHHPSCTFVPGWFEETLPRYEGTAALVLMDVDLIESARTCLRYLWPRLTGPEFFTHEAIHQTYLKGILDRPWWEQTLGCSPPELEGAATGLHPAADCLAVLRHPAWQDRRKTTPDSLATGSPS